MHACTHPSSSFSRPSPSPHSYRLAHVTKVFSRHIHFPLDKSIKDALQLYDFLLSEHTRQADVAFVQVGFLILGGYDVSPALFWVYVGFDWVVDVGDGCSKYELCLSIQPPYMSRVGDADGWEGGRGYTWEGKEANTYLTPGRAVLAAGKQGHDRGTLH